MITSVFFTYLTKHVLNVLTIPQDTQPLLALPSVPVTLASQVETQVARLESREDDNDMDLLQARCGRHDRYACVSHQGIPKTLSNKHFCPNLESLSRSGNPINA